MIRLITDLAIHGISCLWQTPTHSTTTSSSTSFTSFSNSGDKENVPVRTEIEGNDMRRKCIVRMSAISLLSCLADNDSYKDIILSDCVCVLIALAENCHSNR